MKEKQDIFKQFKEQADQLEEMPSSKAWERLETRLQGKAQPTTAKIVRFRTWAVAASLLAILSIISILSTFLIQPEERYAEAEIEAITEISASEPLLLSDAPSYDVYNLQQHYRKGKIEEGSATKKLVAAVNYFYNDTKTQVVEETTDSKKEVAVTENIQALTTEPKVNFNWLEGSWKGKIAAGNSVENWQKIDGIFYGEGYLIQQSDTVFMERMKIVNKGKDWFYVLQLDPYSNASVYQLETASPRKIIFASDTQKFPAKVALIRNENGGFSTQLLANKSIELSPTQLDFLTKRNVLLIDRAVRNLVRK
ncbi:MAG: DUF6265 family protein [Bacteroidota bacterium]